MKNIVIVGAWLFGVFSSGLVLGAAVAYNPQQPEKPITVVYNKDCYVEYDDRELRVKPITIQDLGGME